ncbi:MAG: single-strand DNA-binding protein [Campylobacterota bacterium]|nr:single-strand DNA-binding protein [Campylobacterota bacterium]
MYNKVILVGNLTRDIELRYSQGGMGIANTGLATSRKFTANGEKREEVCFIDITFFARSAEIANQYLRKGSKILIEGRLNFDQWVDQNGQKRSKHSVVVETMQMLDPKNSGAGGGGGEPAAHGHEGGYDAGAAPHSNHTDYRAAPAQAKREMPEQGLIPSIEIDEDEIPF